MPNYWRTVYVIELDDDAPLGEREDPQKPYLYVGITHNTPEARFAVHQAGGRTAAPIVTKHGVKLRPDLYKNFKKVRGDKDAAEQEQRVAEKLRERGYVVYSGKPGFYWDQFK